MPHSFLLRLTAWLCLSMTLLAGVTPAQGFVLCIEADGCLSIELKSVVADCGGCEGHEEGVLAGSVDAQPAESTDCGCIDLSLPSSPQDQRQQPKPVEFQVGPWIAPLCDLFSQQLTALCGATRAPPSVAPRPPDALALIRSVVLLV